MTGPTGPGGPIPDTEQTLEFRRPSTARRTAAFAGIAAAAVIAVLVIVTLAFRGDSNVLSPEQVAQQLAGGSSSGEPSSFASASASDEPSPDTSASPDVTTPGDSGSPAVVDTVAATLTLTCDGTQLTHATWSIKPGYRLDERHQTSTAVVLKIESDVHDDVLVKAYCPAGPRVVVSAEPDDHGGGDDGGGNGGGPGHG